MMGSKLRAKFREMVKKENRIPWDVREVDISCGSLPDKPVTYQQLLPYVARSNNISLLRSFLQMNPTLNLVDAIYVAIGDTRTSDCRNISYEFLNLLQHHGASVNYRCDATGGETALHKAAINNYKEVAKSLVKLGACFDSIDYCSRTPVQNAVEHNSTATARFLIKCDTKNEKINDLDKECKTLLYSATKKYNVKVVSLLLERGADQSIARFAGQIPLAVAVKDGSYQCAKLLFKQKPELQVWKDYNGNNLFHYAVRGEFGHPGYRCYKLLWKRKVDINGVNQDGQTPLHILAEKANNDIAVGLFLNQYGANCLIRDKNGKTPYDIALKNDQTQAAAQMVSYIQCKSEQ